jgi:hypothetical protein
MAGFYAVAALITAASVYGRLEAVRLPHDDAMKTAIVAGIMWPGYWTVKGAYRAYQGLL